MSIANTLRWTMAGAMLAAAAVPAGALELPFGMGRVGGGASREAPETPAEAPVRMAQLGDAGQRISQLEEENRRLNGKVEELSFQLLQMQEQLRKIQEDNEFRFQELEGKGGGGAPSKPRTELPPAAGEAPRDTAAAAPGAAPATSGDEIGSLLGSGGLDTSGLGGGAATPPRTPAAAAESPTVAKIKAGSAGELYGLAYNYLLAGDYGLAEDSFRQYTQTYPDAKDVPDARYWLGESLFQQAKYTDAAEVFLNAQKDYPKSAKAPEMMLKLGMSLAKLENRDTACVTFKEVTRRYPQVSATVKRKLEAESKAANC